MNYGFFDYKYNIQGFSSDLFSTAHIIYIFAVIVFSIAFGIIARRTSHKKIDVFIKVLSIVTLVLEITKITWESYYDITTGRGFNYFGLLPLYTCSLFIYTLLIAAWGKGKVKDASLSFLTTICMMSGAIGVVYCNGLNYYPFWTFGAFYSLFFHSSMFFTGFFLIATGYKKLDWKDVYIGWFPMVALAIVAIPVNYIIKSDYMQVYEGSGVPLKSDLSKILAGVGLRFVFSILMLASYMLLSVIVIGVYKIICAVINKKQAVNR